MATSGGAVLIRGARVFDGHRVRDGVSVLIRDGLIARMGPDLAAEAGDESVEASGLTLLPGLIDAHTHVLPGSLEQALLFGVTTELDMFADPPVIAELKQFAARRNTMADLRSAGTGATAPGGHPSRLVDRGLLAPFPTVRSPDDAQRFVADRVAEGSDYLKIVVEPGVSMGRPMPSPSPQTVSALVEAGHQQGLLVVVHITDQATARIAVDAGADGLVHLFLDAEPTPGLAEDIAARRMFVIPTLTAIDGLWGARKPAAALTHDERITPYLDPTSIGTLNLPGLLAAGPAAPRAPVVPGRPAHARFALRAVHEAGATILAGTDASSPGTAHGASMHQELQLLVEAGLSPIAALTAATAAPAERFGLPDRGGIAPGLLADLLLVAGDPTKDITASRNIVAVWRRGARLDRVRP